MPRRSKGEIEEQRRIGQRIRFHRLRLDLTLAQIADVLEVPYQLVQRLESGAAVLTVPRLLKLAEAFRLDPSELLRDFSNFEAREAFAASQELTADERNLLEAWHRITDRVQKRNVLALLERMTQRDGS